MIDKPSRRDFFKQAVAAGTLLSMGLSTQGKAADQGVKIGVFSKHMQWLNARETAEVTAEYGWDGIECPVRPGGHVLPERVKDDLPAMVEALKKNGVDMLVAATGFNDVHDPYAMDILRVMSENGVNLYRPNWYKYDDKTLIPVQLEKIAPRLQELAAVNAELGVCMAYQNHSGGEYVGGPVWDLYGLIKNLDPKYMGMAFDIGHATVEGGYTWRVDARLMRDRMKVVIVKDFKWAKDNRGKWQAAWCPLGEGMVDVDFFTWLKETGFNGVIIQHFEYEVEGRTEKDIRANSLKAMKKDCETLQAWLKQAGLR